jgi:pyroglutamyl-peptidase
MTARPAIVLTGFGPFPGVPENATARLVPRLATEARAQFTTYDVVSGILPTEWVEGPQRLTQLLEGVDAVLVLHFGVSQDAEGFQLELIGRNLRTSLCDAFGELPASGEVIEAGPALLASTLPAERIIARLGRHGLPCATSDNAGSFLCNALLYHSLAAARALPKPCLVGFVHLPAKLLGHGPDGRAPHPGCPLDWQTAVAGGLEIIASCLEIAGEPPPVKTS